MMYRPRGVSGNQGQDLKRVRAGVLDIAYFELGPEDGIPTILLHGFPYDPHAYDEVASTLAASGHRCIDPSFVATARPASCPRRRHDPASRRQLVRTCWR